MAAVGLGAIACASAVVPMAPRPVQAADPRPNIIIVYVDDVNPNARRLWCTSRTPELAKFCNKGVDFRQAYSSTPLCGPARAVLLTGQYSHNNGVTDNDGPSYLRFDAGSTLATKLQASGYHTVFAGKPINGIGRVTSRQDVAKSAKGWSDYGMMWKRDEKYKSFYRYKWWTPTQVTWKGTRAVDHSTKVIGNRVAKQIRNAPDSKPIFALASLYSGHTPNIAMAGDVGSRACRDVSPWRGKSYNEWNVQDKPAYIRQRPLLKAKSFSLRTRCEEMLSVDKVMGQIRNALGKERRLYNTLIIFMADNGLLMGDHRKPAGKRWPHATPIPMYVMWPKELGNRKRVVSEPVSDADLAPTLCKLGGCTMNDPDGMSILPLLRGNADRLQRDFIYIEHLHKSGSMPPWYGLVTTRRHSTIATWQYVEYRSGERELYNLKKDPLRLSNAAKWKSQQQRVEQLHQKLHNQVITPEDVKFR